MNAKQVFFVSTLLVATAVSARPVPPEEWVGAPIVSAGTASREAVVASFFASMPDREAPQELRVGPADPASGDASRAVVMADTALWLRAGLGQSTYSDGFDPTSESHRQQIATYQRMRNGPEFLAELDRIQGVQTLAATTNAQEASTAE